MNTYYALIYPGQSKKEDAINGQSNINNFLNAIEKLSLVKNSGIYMPIGSLIKYKEITYIPIIFLKDDANDSLDSELKTIKNYYNLVLSWVS